MQTKEAMCHVVEFAHMVVGMYIQDLKESELFVRSVPETNHIAWQLGHLITSTKRMIEALGQSTPELPAGFEAQYTKATANSDDPATFSKKAEYLQLITQFKAASLAAIRATPDEAMDTPGPEPMRDYAPTVASVLSLLGTHWLMHAGQFVPIRRKLGYPSLF